MEETIQRAFYSVLPYLVYPQELRMLLEKKSVMTPCALIEELKKESLTLDEVRRTDIRIFLNELERLIRAGEEGV
jgi:hypothetical protein